MPDWSYHPLFRPWMLARPKLAQQLVLTVLRTIGARSPICRFIDVLGHMRPPPAVVREVAGLSCASPIGLGATIDPRGDALLAFERFGFGYIELGPVALASSSAAGNAPSVDRRARSYRCELQPSSVEEFKRRHGDRRSRLGVKRFVRIKAASTEEARALIAELRGCADLVLLEASVAEAAPRDAPWGLIVALDRCSQAAGIDAPLIVLDPSDHDHQPADLARGLAAIEAVRASSPKSKILYAAGGAEAPRDALLLFERGADLLSLSHGFVFTGPELPKRINAAIETSRPPAAPSLPREMPLIEAAHYSWFWGGMLGLAMIAGALLAGWFALSRVILPYDEAATGLTYEQLRALLGGKILHFMSHDRFTLAGTMVSVGILYCGLSFIGMKRGLLWAKEVVVASSFVGFLTFFAFVAYGYFDQFHAFIAAMLFPVTLQIAVGRDVEPIIHRAPDLDNDAKWRRALYGRLLFVAQAVGLLAGGTIIMTLGSSSVFVPSDLEFIGMNAEAMHSIHANLVPLIAHDRATFGGMLISTGIAVLFTTLWGFVRGASWLWWTLALAGFPAYFATLWIHSNIGYTDLLHLSPVFIGLVWHIAAVALTRGFLCDAARS